MNIEMKLVSKRNRNESHVSEMEQYNFLLNGDEEKLLSGYVVFSLEYTGSRLGWQWSLSVYIVSRKDFNLNMNNVFISGHYPELDDAKKRLVTYLKDEINWLSNL